jgi:3-phosphoshikimate 1-carboxyvinyltransferase
MNLSLKQFIVNPGGRLQGTLRVPGDKSISHRAIILGAIAEGITKVSGFLEGEDTLATLAAFQAMGVPIDGPIDGQVTLHGVGLHGLRAPNVSLSDGEIFHTQGGNHKGLPLHLGNSGTSMRLLSGLMAGQAFSVTLNGDASLSRRPMRRVTEPLTQMGAKIETTEFGTPPLIIHGGQRLQAIDYSMPIASAQVKSCLLLAGLYANGTTCVSEPAPTRDHTERMLAGFGYSVKRQESRVCLVGGGQLQARNIEVPADISSAAFFIVGACIAPGSEILLEHVGLNPTRIGIIHILQKMGADIRLHNQRDIGGEPVADILVRYHPLHGIQIPKEQVPLAIDEFPIIFIAAACADGQTVLTGAEELRVKESDRIQVMADGLQTLGIEAEPTPDGMVIQGGNMHGGTINSQGDHRVAMAFTIAALRATEPVIIDDCANVATSFPNFIDLAHQAGIEMTQQ